LFAIGLQMQIVVVALFCNIFILKRKASINVVSSQVFGFSWLEWRYTNSARFLVIFMLSVITSVWSNEPRHFLNKASLTL